MSRKGRRGSKRLKKWGRKSDTYIGKRSNIYKFLKGSYKRGAGAMIVPEIEITYGG